MASEGQDDGTIKLDSTQLRGKMIRTGGLGEINEKDDQIVAIVNEIKPILEEKTGEKYEKLDVLSYKTQLVAGTNYFVKVSC